MSAIKTKDNFVKWLLGYITLTVVLLFLISSATTKAYAAVEEDSLEQPTASANASVNAVNTLPTLSIEDQEGEETFGLIAFIISLNTPTSSTVTGKVSTVNVTATAPADYTALTNQPFTITAGSTETVVYVDLVDDAFREITETFKLSVTQLSNATTTAVEGQGWAYGQIIDDDTIPGVSIADTSVNESAGTATLQLSLSAPHTSNTTVTIETGEDSANAGLDFVDTTKTITIPTGELTATVAISIVDDLLYEANEKFVVAISNASVLIEDDAAQVTILDNDTAPNLTVQPVTDTEASGVLVFTITLDVPSGLDVTGLAATSNGTAKANADYVGLSNKIFTIPSGLTETTVYVAVLNENQFERNETFTLTVSSVANATVVKNANVGTILNDDLPPIVSIADVSNSENGILAFTISVNTTSGIDVTGLVTTSNGSAIAGQDYTALVAKPFTITAGSSSTTVTVTPINDALDEPNETFTATVGNLVDATAGDLVAIGTIIDNDPPAVLTIEDASASEGAGSITFTLSLNTASSFDISGLLNTVDGSAVEIEDYQPLTLQPFIIKAGTLYTQVVVSTYNDTMDEDDEVFTLAAVNVENASQISVEGIGVIVDDDPMPLLTMTSTTFEESSSGVITLSLSFPSGRAISGTLVTSDGSATANQDYGPLNHASFTIQPGELETSVEFYIINDTIDEYDENFQASLATLNGASASNSTIEITLLDDDAPPTIGLLQSSASETQGQLQIPVQLSQISGKEITGTLSTSNGSATSPADYSALLSKPFTIAAGLTQTLVNVPLVNDTLYESDETFGVTLNNATNATIVTNTATATIVNDDQPPVVTIADTSATESNGVLTFTISLNTLSALPVTGVASTSNGSALSGSDFVALTDAPFTIPAGSTSTIISVTVNDDSRDEYDEQLSLQLSNLVNAQEGGAQAIGTIVDDDLPATVSISNASASESSKSITFTVSVNPASGKEIKLLLTTTDGSAVANQDYTPQTNSLVTLSPGTTSQTIQVQVNNDASDEPNESFTLAVALMDASTASLATPTVTGTILDDDLPPTLTVADATASETSGALVFTLKLSAASGFTVTGKVNTTNGTATAGSDYTTLQNQTFAFAIGSTQTTVSVPLYNDYLLESSETFTLTVTTASPATIQDGVAIGTITDEDSVGSGTLTIQVNVTPKSIQNFKFVPSFGNEFYLDDEEGAAQNDGYARSKSFTLAAGTYTVQPVIPYSFFLMEIICTADGMEIKHDSEPQLPVVGSGQSVFCTFVNQRGVTIRTQSYDDRSKNRQFDSADVMLAGVTAALFVPPENTPLLSQTTDNTGKLDWSFRKPGDYAVCATDWPTATPMMVQPTLSDSLYHTPCYRFNLAPGTVADIYFGFRVDDGSVRAAVEGLNEVDATQGTGSLETGVLFSQITDVTDDMQGYDESNSAEAQIKVFLPVMAR